MAQDIENSTFHELLTFLVLEARISSFYLVELLELIQEKSGNIPGKNGKRNFEEFWNSRISKFWKP